MRRRWYYTIVWRWENGQWVEHRSRMTLGALESGSCGFKQSPLSTDNEFNSGGYKLFSVYVAMGYYEQGIYHWQECGHLGNW